MLVILDEMQNTSKMGLRSFLFVSGMALGGALVEAPGVAGMVPLHKQAPLRNGSQKLHFFVAFTKCFWYHSPSPAYGNVWGSLARPTGCRINRGAFINTAKTQQAKAV
jgi:hypothetical protein